MCAKCGQHATRWVGRCSACGAWGTMEEITLAPVPDAPSGGGPGAALRLSTSAPDASEPTGLAELDRVLGGGLVRGGAYLLAGEPGVGKSTLLFQVASRAAAAGRRVLLICGEETPGAGADPRRPAGRSAGRACGPPERPTSPSR